MQNENINQQFREDEIALIRNKQFPKIGGRLRLAHEANAALSIETEIFRYDGNLAVVIAVTKTTKGSFRGIGMASVERDQKLAHAILELAETRAIARSLRFAGYGLEYCSAEEMPLTENGNGSGNGSGSGGNGHQSQRNQNENLPPKGHCNSDNLPAGGNCNGGNSGNGNSSHPPINGSGSNNPANVSGGNGNGSGGNGGSDSSSNGGNVNGGNGDNINGRLTAKQYRYIQKLNEDMGRASADLEKIAVAMFGVKSQFLSKGDASSLISHLLEK